MRKLVLHYRELPAQMAHALYNYLVRKISNNTHHNSKFEEEKNAHIIHLLKIEFLNHNSNTKRKYSIANLLKNC